MHKHRTPLDVTQKVEAQTAALGGAGNQARNISDGEGVLTR